MARCTAAQCQPSISKSYQSVMEPAPMLQLQKDQIQAPIRGCCCHDWDFQSWAYRPQGIIFLDWHARPPGKLQIDASCCIAHDPGDKHLNLQCCGLQIDFNKLNAVFGELPSVDSMSRAEDLEGFLQKGTHGRSMYRLVRPLRLSLADSSTAVLLEHVRVG